MELLYFSQLHANFPLCLSVTYGTINWPFVMSKQGHGMWSTDRLPLSVPSKGDTQSRGLCYQERSTLKATSFYKDFPASHFMVTIMSPAETEAKFENFC